MDGLFVRELGGHSAPAERLWWLQGGYEKVKANSTGVKYHNTMVGPATMQAGTDDDDVVLEFQEAQGKWTHCGLSDQDLPKVPPLSTAGANSKSCL